MLQSERARNQSKVALLEKDSQEFVGPMILVQEMQQPHFGQSNSDIIYSDVLQSNQDHNKSNYLRSIENSLFGINEQSKFQGPLHSIVKENQKQKDSYISQDISDYQFLMKSEYIKMSSLSSHQYIGYPAKHLFSSKMNHLSTILCFVFHQLSFLYLPLMLSFNLSDLPLFSFICMKIFEIVVALNTQLTDEINLTHQKHQSIMKKYLNSLLIFDSVNLSLKQIYILGLIFMIILLKFKEYIKQVDWILLLIVLSSQQKRYSKLERFVKNYCNWHTMTQQVISFSFLIFLYINLLVCFWKHFIRLDNSINSYALSMQNIISIISMNSTFIPKDTEQIFTSIFVMVCGIGIYVKVFRFFALQFYFQDNLKAELDKYFEKNDQIDIKLKNQICDEVCGQQYQTNQFIISKLSPHTIKQLQKQQRYSILQEYFSEYSVDTITKVIDCCEDIWCIPGQSVISQNFPDDSSLYFIKEGEFKVQILAQQILKTLNVMKYLIQVGQTFGEYSFYSQQPRMATIVCVEQGHLLKVPRIGFLKCLNYNEKQLFCLSQDRLVYQNINPHNQKCYCCEATNHLIANCPKLTYKPSKLRVIKEINQPHIQHRYDIVRKRKRRSVNAISNSVEGQSIDVDLFYYMFCDKWDQQTLDDSGSSLLEQPDQEQEQEYGFDQEINESIQITQSAMGEIPNIQNSLQDSVPFSAQLSSVVNQFQERDQKRDYSINSPIRISSDNTQKLKVQMLKLVNNKMMAPQKQQYKSLKCIPESEYSDYISINDDISEFSTPVGKGSEIDRKNQDINNRNNKKQKSVNQEQQQHMLTIFSPRHSLQIPNRAIISPEAESSKKIKTAKSSVSEQQKSRSNIISNFHTLSNLYNQQSQQADHSEMSVINNGFDKLSKFDIYYPEYNFDPQIKAMSSQKFHQV